MKAIGIIGLEVAIALYCMAFSLALVQPQPPHEYYDTHQKANPYPPESSSASLASRRTFGIVASASLSSLVIGSTDGTYSARADIVDALYAPISTPFNELKNEVTNDPKTFKAIPQKATIQRVQDWALPKLFSDLGIMRINTDSLLPLPTSLPFASRDTLYPRTFIGEWTVRATLQRKIFPFGPDFLPSTSLVDGSPNGSGEKVGDSTAYTVRYLPASNNGEVFATADRAFNLLSRNRSYQQQQQQQQQQNASPSILVDSVRWDPEKNPTKLFFQTEASASTEVILTSRKTEDLTRTFKPESRVFACSERSRAVTSTANANAKTEADSEITTEFRPVGPDTIRAVSRVALYLLPNQGTLWSKVKGKAVAFYDYELLMERQRP